MELDKGLKSLDFKDALVENLKRIMKDKGLNQVDLARISGVKQATLSHILTKRRPATYETLVELCKGLGIEHTDLTSHPGLLEAFNKLEKLQLEKLNK